MEHLGDAGLDRGGLEGPQHGLARERREVLDLLLFAAAVGALISGAAIVGLPYLIRTSLGPIPGRRRTTGHRASAQGAGRTWR